MDQSGYHEPVKIEQGTRKAPKIGGHLEPIDLAGLILLLAFVPTMGRQFFGANGFVLLTPGVLYILFLFFFKINKPKGYFSQFMKFHNRSRIWSPAPYKLEEPFPESESGEGSVNLGKIERRETR